MSFAKLTRIAYHFSKWANRHKDIEWSEEDEHRRTDAIYFLESAMKHYADTSEIEKTIDWLKSLPMRCPKSSDNWKPSEEQMEALRKAVNKLADTEVADSVRLSIMYDHLKKLM